MILKKYFNKILKLTLKEILKEILCLIQKAIPNEILNKKSSRTLQTDFPHLSRQLKMILKKYSVYIERNTERNIEGNVERNVEVKRIPTLAQTDLFPPKQPSFAIVR